jgi:hypothetical protein
MRENESGEASLVTSKADSNDSRDTMNDEYDQPISSEYQAYNEWMLYCGITNFSQYFLKKFKKEG